MKRYTDDLFPFNPEKTTLFKPGIRRWLRTISCDNRPGGIYVSIERQVGILKYTMRGQEEFGPVWGTRVYTPTLASQRRLHGIITKAVNRNAGRIELHTSGYSYESNCY